MAKILFLHPNFPAQFKAPCISLAEQNKHDIIFLCQTHYGRNIPGVQKLVIKGRGSHDQTILSSKTEYERTIYRAAVYRDAFYSLLLRGWSPDVVISHCGWGCGLYLKDIWPHCRSITYVEWWFHPQSNLQQRLKNNPYFQLSAQSISNLTIRNLPTCYEMNMADNIVTPTDWQKQQLPKRLQSQCLVIRDQVNKTLFFPEPQKQSRHPIVTYGTRGMEAMRGFPEFITILPRLLQKWPQIHIEIAGVDEINYGGKAPSEGSWKQWAVALLEKHNVAERVLWKGRLPLPSYVKWIKETWCHVYLSEPFVTSWSFIEACYCSVPMVATQSPRNRRI